MKNINNNSYTYTYTYIREVDDFGQYEVTLYGRDNNDVEHELASHSVFVFNTMGGLTFSISNDDSHTYYSGYDHTFEAVTSAAYVIAEQNGVEVEHIEGCHYFDALEAAYYEELDELEA